jgi:catechol 2,3-dioxygenase-like lactoylglutathione lyase family enzyme
VAAGELPALDRCRLFAAIMLRPAGQDAARTWPAGPGACIEHRRTGDFEMIGYATIGVNDLEIAAAFYDVLLGEMGARRLFSSDRLKLYGTGMDAAMLGICIPYDKQPQHPGNGNMIAIDCHSRESVDRLYAKAMELGATDEGGPGERMPTFYGAYVRDLDGNKLCFYEMRM